MKNGWDFTYPHPLDPNLLVGSQINKRLIKSFNSGLVLSFAQFLTFYAYKHTFSNSSGEEFIYFYEKGGV